jgi:hypothetical protein
LTAEARQLLDNFRALRERVNVAADQFFSQTFQEKG